MIKVNDGEEVSWVNFIINNIKRHACKVSSAECLYILVYKFVQKKFELF